MSYILNLIPWCACILPPFSGTNICVPATLMPLASCQQHMSTAAHMRVHCCKQFSSTLKHHVMCAIVPQFIEVRGALGTGEIPDNGGPGAPGKTRPAQASQGTDTTLSFRDPLQAAWARKRKLGGSPSVTSVCLHLTIPLSRAMQRFGHARKLTRPLARLMCEEYLQVQP